VRVVAVLAVLLLISPAALAGAATRAPITAGKDWWPVFAPDDHAIAFTRINGTGRVFTLEVLNLRTHRVTALGANAGRLDPTWSPDSKQVAYTSGGILWVVNDDGSGKHRYPAPTRSFAPAWRPGAQQLAYLTTHGAQNTDLWVGSERWAPNVIGQPSWVTGEDAVAFTRDDGVYVAAGPGSEERLVSVASPQYAAGSPDGTFVAYAAAGSVYIVRADGTGGGPLKVAGPFPDIGPLSWSRESDALAYTVRGAVELTYLSGKTVRLVSGAGVGTSFAHHGDVLAFSGVHRGCTGHTTIRVYEDNAHVPSYTGGCGIAGTSEADVVYGTAQGGDVISAGAGADRVHARNGHRDAISCGPGRDVVWADRSDRLTGCEVVYR